MPETKEHSTVTFVRERLEEGFTRTLQRIEEPTINGIRLYVMQGIPVGGFMYGCLSNDFLEAIGRADMNNLRHIQDIATLIYTYLPSDAHGSKEAVHKWVESGGIIGKYANKEED